MTIGAGEPNFLNTNVSQLLTHNVADFRRYAAFITVLPLQEQADQP
jgi:hypothetical protein